jgi:anti-anti-sigma factor
MTISLTVSHVQGRVPVTVLQPQGDLDASNYQDLIAEVRKAYAIGARDILLDMTEVPYMSSSGVFALHSIAALLRGEEPPDPEMGWSALHTLDRGREAGCQTHFKLLGPQPAVDRVLDMVGFKRLLYIFDDLQAAVASF